jgi:SEC-C motif
MFSSNHAEHFLSRVDRLNAAQAELALGLYRDHGLVAFLLRLAEVPPSADRVAIALSEGDDGPWVIVTREGKFVTCLAQGMRLRAEQTLISRRTLDRLANKVQALREVLEGSARGERRRCDQLLQRVCELGHRVTQSDFDDLAKWSPVMGGLYVQNVLLAQDRVERVYEQLRLEKRLGKRAEPLLRKYWTDLWAMTHFSLLAFDQPEHPQRLFDRVDLRQERSEISRLLFVLPLWQSRLLPLALRGAWLAAQLPKAFLKPLKVGYTKARQDWELYALGSGLAAIGHRHQRYRAEIAKFLVRDESNEASALDAFTGALGRTLVQGYEHESRAALLELPAHETELCMDALAETAASATKTKAYLRSLPEATRLAIMLTLPLPLSLESGGFTRALMYVPAVARMQARDFYLPDSASSVLLSQGYTPAIAELCVRSRLEQDPQYKPTPSRAPARPGRNDACPCGSGKKYKRCCEGTANGRQAARNGRNEA